MRDDWGSLFSAEFHWGGVEVVGIVGVSRSAARWTRWANPNVEERVNGNLFGWPSPTRIYGLLLSGYRGLLFTSPVLILAAVGWPALRRARPAAALVCAGIVLAFVLLIASFHEWHGGWAPGARYLIPCLPFAAVPMAFAFERLRFIATTLAAISVLFMTAITVVAIEIPMQSPVPLLDFVAYYTGRDACRLIQQESMSAFLLPFISQFIHRKTIIPAIWENFYSPVAWKVLCRCSFSGRSLVSCCYGPYPCAQRPEKI